MVIDSQSVLCFRINIPPWGEEEEDKLFIMSALIGPDTLPYSFHLFRIESTCQSTKYQLYIRDLYYAFWQPHAISQKKSLLWVAGI